MSDAPPERVVTCHGHMMGVPFEQVTFRKPTDNGDRRTCKGCKVEKDITDFGYNPEAFERHPNIDDFCQICWSCP